MQNYYQLTYYLASLPIALPPALLLYTFHRSLPLTKHGGMRSYPAPHLLRYTEISSSGLPTYRLSSPYRAWAGGGARTSWLPRFLVKGIWPMVRGDGEHDGPYRRGVALWRRCVSI